MSVFLAGHRGMGCTDHEKYQWRDLQNLPVENTVASISMAFEQGASYVEIDALIAKAGPDGKPSIFVLHNTVPDDHFFGTRIPPQKLNHMDFDDIRSYQTGRLHKGEVALLSDILSVTDEKSPRDLPWSINIELKHSAGSKQPYSEDGFLQNVAEIVRQSNLNEDEVLFSSFDLGMVLGMSHLLPKARYGMLFREQKDGDAVGQPPMNGVYTDHTDDPHHQYLPFSANTVDLVAIEWQSHAHPDAKLGFMHPEIMTVTAPMIDLMAKRGYGLNVWALFERLDDNRADTYQHVTADCAERNVPLTIITDYLPEMQALKL